MNNSILLKHYSILCSVGFCLIIFFFLNSVAGERLINENKQNAYSILWMDDLQNNKLEEANESAKTVRGAERPVSTSLCY